MSKQISDNKITRASTFEKVLHWLVLLSFLGLCATALAAEHFFSKEAILDSFQISLPMVNANIAPADQFFISRIARRDTWDVHFYFGVAFAIFTLAWLIIGITRKNKQNIILKTILFTNAIVMSLTGVMMFLRLYDPISEELFSLLKKIHYYSYWIFIYTLIAHIVLIIYKENTKSNGVVSKMFKFRNIATIMFIGIAFISPNTLHANVYNSDGTQLKKWVSDQNYVDGVMYIEGAKGAGILEKEIVNCPYEKCHLADIDMKQFGTITIKILKPDFKKAIEQLSIASSNGNALAADRLLKFLVKRIDYKSKKPNHYLLKLLKEETNLEYEDYVKLINTTTKNGIESGKSCFSEFLQAEMFEYGILNNLKDKNKAIEYYKKAADICSSTNLHKMLAQGKINALNR